MQELVLRACCFNAYFSTDLQGCRATRYAQRQMPQAIPSHASVSSDCFGSWRINVLMAAREGRVQQIHFLTLITRR